jgi:hypothetical protein
MAKIDFDTKNIGKQIHDDGEFDLPAHLHSGEGQDLTLPSRFGINKSEDPVIIFDRFPNWTDAAVKIELERIWTYDVWPGRVSEFLGDTEQIKAEANARFREAGWKLEKALDTAAGDWTHDDVVAALADRAECRAKSGEHEQLIKDALVARKHPDDWPEPDAWICPLMDKNKPVQDGSDTDAGIAATKAARVKADFGVEDPGSGL